MCLKVTQPVLLRLKMGYMPRSNITYVPFNVYDDCDKVLVPGGLEPISSNGLGFCTDVENINCGHICSFYVDNNCRQRDG